MSLFTVSNTSFNSRIVHAPYAAVLEVLHDPAALIRLGSLATGFTVDPIDPNLYDVTDRISFLGCFHTETKFKAKFTTLENGMISDVDANFGTNVKSQWKARSIEGGGTQVDVETSVKSFFIFAPYVFSTIKSTRPALLANLAAKLENQGSTSARRARRRAPGLTLILLVSLSAVSIFLTELSRGWYTGYNQILAYAVVGGTILLCSWLAMISRDPYSMFHLSLNKLSGEDSESDPRTEWLNMGYWKDSKVFPQACEALALRLAHAGGCKAGGNVLDVGHATGESLLLQLFHPSVPRPSRLSGITSLLSHHQRAKDRVARVTDSSKTEVTLYHGDAVYRPSAIGHPLDPSSDSPPFTTILALDCAYHFNTRYIFLGQCFARLSPGGRVALADICFSPEALQNNLTRLLAPLVGLMPRANMTSPEKYVQALEEIGFVDVTMEDVSEDVFPGFIRFLKSRGVGWGFFGNVVKWYVGVGARFVIVTGSKL